MDFRNYTQAALGDSLTVQDDHGACEDITGGNFDPEYERAVLVWNETGAHISINVESAKQRFSVVIGNAYYDSDSIDELAEPLADWYAGEYTEREEQITRGLRLDYLRFCVEADLPRWLRPEEQRQVRQMTEEEEAWLTKYERRMSQFVDFD